MSQPHSNRSANGAIPEPFGVPTRHHSAMTATATPITATAVKPSELAERVGEGLATFEGIIVPTQAQKTAVRQMHSLLKMGEKQPEGQQRRAYRYLHHSGSGKGFTDALIDAVHKRSTSRRNVRYKGMGHYVSGIESDLLPTIVRAELDNVLNPVKSSRDGIPDDQIGMRDAALLIGQSEHKLATGRRNGQLALRICRRANRIIPTLDRAEIEELNDLLHNRLGPEKFTHSLHLPQYAMAQLSVEKLITCITHPYVVAHHGPLQAHALELEAFRDALLHEAAPIDAIDCPTPLHRAARGMGGGPKPWGEIFRDLLNRTIRYSIKGRLSVDRIMISAGDAAKLRSRDLTTASLNVRSRFVSQRDAAEILNLPIKHAHLLPVSRRRSGGAHEISWSRVRRLARNRITLAELSARSGIQGTTLKHVLEREGCPRHDELGWIRSKALAKIANY